MMSVEGLAVMWNKLFVSLSKNMSFTLSSNIEVYYDSKLSLEPSQMKSSQKFI